LEQVAERVADAVFGALDEKLNSALAAATTQTVGLLTRRAQVDSIENVKLAGRLEERILVLESSIEAGSQPAIKERDASVIESLERRASRQGDHLQRLEDRVKRLEGKA
jgi:hypothetical protein